jgi:hypothetical protein
LIIKITIIALSWKRGERKKKETRDNEDKRREGRKMKTH